VTGLYQASDYRGLPPAFAKASKREVHWEYFCSVVIDRYGPMRKAWNDVRSKVKTSFRESVNMLPIILSPPGVA